MKEPGYKLPAVGRNQPPLPRSVQEHLGRLLRHAFFEADEKPQYLGDPVTPQHFDSLIEKIEDKERIRRKLRIEEAGHQAVAAALMDFIEREPAIFRKR